ncbi:MAG: T9SS type A sorting domain-containing protein [Saprospiraceae bacterium]
MKAQEVILDPDFGIGGVGEKWSNGPSHSVGMEVDDSDLIYLFGGGLLSGLGYLNPTIVRYSSNGLLDLSFGIEGKVILDIEGGGLFRDVSFQSNGKILALGSFPNMGYEFVLYRFHQDGRIDSSFAENGSIIFYGWEAHSVVVLENDKILVSGDFAGKMRVVCFDAKGEVEPSFGDFGYATGNDQGSKGKVNNLVVDQSGNIIVYGKSQSDLILKKFDANGQPDTGFGQSGTARFETYSGHKLPFVNAALTLQDDGKIIVGFENVSAGTYYGWGVIRFQSNGNLDAGFGDGGISLMPRIYFGRLFTVVDISIDENGRLWLAGTSYTHNWPSDYIGALALFDSEGKITADFAENGLFIGLETGLANGVEVNDNTLLIGGAYGFSVSRYRLDLLNPVEELDKPVYIETYPNPTHTNSFSLAYKLKAPGPYLLEIFSIQGNLITTSKLDLTKEGVIPIQLPSIPKGSYLLRLSHSDFKPHQQLILFN